jgi:enoyl-CoA hydratase/carnithine racemase
VIAFRIFGPTNIKAEIMTTPFAVRELVLSRNEVRNALDLATTEQLIQSIAEFRDDAAVRAVLLRGEGAGFCAGSDVKEMAQASMSERLRIAERKAQLMRALAELDKPVICAVHGFALGGGFMLAIGCDAVVTATDAVWRLPEVGLGFFPPWGIEALVRRVGIARARWLVWGATQLSGSEALRLGLAEVEAPAEKLLEEARALAIRLAELPAESIRATKRFFREQVPVPGLDALAREVYRENCEAGSAQAAFARFTSKAD